MKTLFLPLFLTIIFLGGCVISDNKDPDMHHLLYKYAQSNCLFWYFTEKGYDTKDLRSISGGIVEKSEVSLDRFQEIALFLKDFSSNLESKNNIDPRLSGCFELESNKELKEIIYSG